MFRGQLLRFLKDEKSVHLLCIDYYVFVPNIVPNIVFQYVLIAFS